MFQIKPEYLKAGELADVVTVGGNLKEIQIRNAVVLTNSTVRLTASDGSIVDVMREKPVTVSRRAY